MASEREESKSHDRDLSRAGISAFLAIAKAWRLTDDEAQALLGVQERATFCSWGTAPPIELPEDVLLHISCVLGIFKALNTLFPEPQQADGWIRRSNTAPLFSGRSALEHMLGGGLAEMLAVRRYLDGQVQCEPLPHSRQSSAAGERQPPIETTPLPDDASLPTFQRLLRSSDGSYRVISLPDLSHLRKPPWRK